MHLAPLFVCSLVGTAAAAAPAVAPDGGDLVERIDDETAAVPAPAPAVPPPAAGRAAPVSLTGWARSSLEVALTRTGFRRDVLDPVGVAHDALIVREQLYLRLRAARGRRLAAVISGALAWNVFEQDPDARDGFNGFNGVATTHAVDALLREAYVGLFARRVDVWAGQQRVAWGRGDAFAPNDVVNARDLRDPLLGETELLQLPTPLVRGVVELPLGSLELVAAPFVPDRFDTYGRNWARVQVDAPAAYRGLLGLATRLVDPSLHQLVQPLLGQTRIPADRAADATGGAHYGLSRGGFDVDLYYHYGFDRTPRLSFGPRFAEVARTMNLGDPAAWSALLGDLSSGLPFSATYVRRHHAGAALQTTSGPFVLRSEGAVDAPMVVVRRADLSGVLCPALQATLGVEYQTGELGKTITVEAWYQRLVDAPPDGTLLGQDRDSAAVAALVRWIFFAHLEVELRAVAGLRPSSYTLRPQVGWRWRDLAVRVGAVLLGGEVGSLAHYYRRNQSVYSMLKYSF
ncbi:MAG TPA: DUF1302 family protein [Polyangia bacterium]|jgi:hypothetical protein